MIERINMPKEDDSCSELLTQMPLGLRLLQRLKHRGDESEVMAQSEKMKALLNERNVSYQHYRIAIAEGGHSKSVAAFHMFEGHCLRRVWYRVNAIGGTYAHTVEVQHD
jgi:hypothetical protein